MAMLLADSTPTVEKNQFEIRVSELPLASAQNLIFAPIATDSGALRNKATLGREKGMT
jgi:hypothetical protein